MSESSRSATELDEALRAAAPRREETSSPECPDAAEQSAPLLEAFQAAIDARVARESCLAEELAQPDDERERSLRRELEALRSARLAELSALEQDYAHRRATLVREAETADAAARDAHLERLREIESRFHREAAEIEERFQDSSWVTASVLDDTAEDSPRRQFERASQLRDRLRDQQAAELAAADARYQAAAQQRGWHERPLTEPERQPRSAEEASQLFSEQTEAARLALDALERLKLPRLFVGLPWVPVLLGTAAVAFALIYLAVNPGWFGVAPGSGLWAPIAAGVALVIGLLLLMVLYTIGSLQQSDALQQVQHALADARWLHERWLMLAAREHQQQQAEFLSRQVEFESQRQAALDRYRRAHEERRSELERLRTQALLEENRRFAHEQSQLRERQRVCLSELDAAHVRRRDELTVEREADELRLHAALEETAHQRRRRQAELWHELKTEWDAAARRLETGVRQAQADSAARFASWEQLAAEGWSPAEQLPSGIRRGEYVIDLECWEHAIPSDMRLAPRSTQFVVPSVVPFPRAAPLLLRFSSAAGRDAAAQLMQSLMLRWLTLLPPGKLRFTIIDPVGLGERFAGFMHLADFDELLVTRRIWTEPDHIERQLADLTEHMENVLQMYLRNEFASIEEYNEFAGEVAEPYRLLVVADFPARFSELAARRLTSIVTTGPRCGVFTLLGLDARQNLPHGFDPGVLDEHLPALIWKPFHEPPRNPDDWRDGNGAEQPGRTRRADAGFAVSTGPLSRWPLAIDQPPPPEQFTAIVRRAGAASKEARRVEVAFDRIAPPAERLWTHSSRSGIDIPLGRAGATKLQRLRLGTGTSQHMLVAGKTGSGKSTFLHCLITNVALHYSPDEVRFSLVDFKKGVEFKDYAACALPHADVIAIESDREFGVSVLQRLDAVLHERGDLFRRHGVQDLAGFRAAQPNTPLPRLLLVIDEFQEFFVEEDRLSQTAALLLDRLVRQGRAFGVHVVLGSQTLGGAYSLARSTLGQVAVRVALQCSEADAHLILSEENTAARLLTRPGEAIYNDANGLVEGNHPFQVAWLPDHERETWLRRIQMLAVAPRFKPAQPIVFEGNVPSDPARNASLAEILSRRFACPSVTPFAPDQAPRPPEPQIWLGEAVEIGPPAAIRFERRNGANLLIVGQDSDAALGILSTAALALAAQGTTPSESNHSSTPSETQETGTVEIAPPITILDGSPPGSPEASAWARLAELFPDILKVESMRLSDDAIRRLSAELKRRLDNAESESPPRFLVVYHLGRFRSLRKRDDDFGLAAFGAGEERPPDAAKLFADLLTNGPAAGIHTLVWCDSANTVERWFSRQTLRELENRVVFQMSASDSSNLIDNPAASKLGVHRALLYREETGTTEKFRPYHAASADWLRSLRPPADPVADVPRQSPPEITALEDAAPPLDVARDLSDFRIL